MTAVSLCGTALLVGWALLVLMAERPVLDSVIRMFPPREFGIFGPIFRGVSARVRFQTTEDCLCVVELMMATYAGASRGLVTFHLFGERGAEVWRRTIAATRVRNNAYHAMEIPPVCEGGGQAFHLSISSTAEASRAITFIVSPWPGDVVPARAQPQMFVDQDGSRPRALEGTPVMRVWHCGRPVRAVDKLAPGRTWRGMFLALAVTYLVGGGGFAGWLLRREVAARGRARGTSNA